jgi:DegV family protein with EDD domain
MLRIVIDGAGDMPAEWETTYAINMLPLHVNFGEEAYTQGPGFTRDDFYRLVKEKQVIPKTSLPSIGQVNAFYRSIAQQGDTILSIHVSSKLSGTFSTIQTAAKELACEFKIYAYDSLAGSVAQAFMAREARIMSQAGASMEEILRQLDAIRQRITVIFTLDNLEFARMSGRVNAIQSLFAAALKLKPIIVLKDGLLEMADKVRTRQRSLEYVVDLVHQRVGDRKVNLAIVHAADPLTANALLEKACGMFRTQEAFATDLSVPVAANLGPGAIGIIAYPIEERN